MIPPAVRPAVPPAAVAAGGVAGLAYLWRTDPHEPGHLLPVCPFRAATGWSCPACGATRATYDLLHGDLAHAFRDNAAFLVVAPAVLWMLGRWLLAGLAGRRYQVSLPRGATPAILGVAVLWTVGRNLA